MNKFWSAACMLITLLSACSPSGSAYKCQDGICIDININGQVQALQPVEFTILVKTEKDVSGLGITIISDGIKQEITAKPEGSELMYQDSRSMDWILNTKGNEEYMFSGIVIFPKPASSIRFIDYDIVVTAVKPGGTRVTDSISIYLDANGNQIDRNQVKILMETELPLPTIPPDLTIVVHTPRPSITPPQDTPTPTPINTQVSYP